MLMLHVIQAPLRNPEISKEEQWPGTLKSSMPCFSKTPFPKHHHNSKLMAPGGSDGFFIQVTNAWPGSHS